MNNVEVALQLTLKAMEMNFGREPRQRAANADIYQAQDNAYIKSTLDFFHAALDAAKEANRSTCPPPPVGV